MTEEDAHSFASLMSQRICGWAIVLGMKNGRTDFRTRCARRSHDLMQDLLLHLPAYEDIAAAMISGEDPADLWPEALRDTVRFQIGHKVPREINEPTSEHNRREREAGIGPPLPEMFDDHGAVATIADHPPLPELSPLMQSIKRGSAADRRRAKLRLIIGDAA